MSSHERDPASGADAGGRPPSSVLPVDLPSAESLSWELGRRIVRDGVPRLVFAENVRFGSSLTAFDVAEHTCVVRVRTPVGRETFYGTTKAALRRGVDELRRRDDWAFSDAPE